MRKINLRPAVPGNDFIPERPVGNIITNKDSREDRDDYPQVIREREYGIQHHIRGKQTDVFLSSHEAHRERLYAQIKERREKRERDRKDQDDQREFTLPDMIEICF